MSEHMFAKISFETISLQKTLWTEIYANQFQQKPRPKSYWKKKFYQKLSEEKSRQYNVRKEKPTKNFEETIYQTLLEKKSLTKKYLKLEFNPNMSEEKNVTKHSVTGNSLPNKLCIKIFSKQIPKKPLPKSI